MNITVLWQRTAFSLYKHTYTYNSLKTHAHVRRNANLFTLKTSFSDNLGI